MAIGDKRSLGTILPGNGVLPFSGSRTIVGVWEKSPANIFSVMTVLLAERLCRLFRSRSHEPMKNVLSRPLYILGRTTGPSISNPYWFCRRAVLRDVDGRK